MAEPTLQTVTRNLLRLYNRLLDSIVRYPPMQTTERVSGGSGAGSKPPVNISELQDKQDNVDSLVRDLAVDVHMYCKGMPAFPNNEDGRGRTVGELQWIANNSHWLFEYPDIEGLVDTLNTIAVEIQQLLEPEPKTADALPDFATYEEIAHALGISEEAVRKRVSRGSLVLDGPYSLGGKNYFRTHGEEVVDHGK